MKINFQIKLGEGVINETLVKEPQMFGKFAISNMMDCASKT